MTSAESGQRPSGGGPGTTPTGHTRPLKPKLKVIQSNDPLTLAAFNRELEVFARHKDE